MRKFLLGILITCAAACALAFAGCIQDGEKPDAATYTIQYFDGSQNRTIEVKNGELYTIDVPEKKGYDFTGLFTDEVGGVKYVNANGSCLEAFNANKNIVLFAQFEPKKFNVTFNYGEAGNADYTLEADYGDTLPDVPEPNDVYEKSFEGWYTEENCGGKKLESGTVLNYDNFDENALSGGKITFFAGFKTVLYTVTFYDKDGTNVIKTEEAAYGTPISEIGTGVEYNGKVVLEWAYFKNGSPYKGEVMGDSDFYAISYGIDIVFDSDGGSTVSLGTVKTGETVTLPEPKREYFIFEGWYDNGVLADNSFTVPDRKVTLTAKWKQQFEDYTYISTSAELNKVNGNKSGKYLLINDLNLNGASWAIIDKFSGTFDGGGHAIYNFSVTSSAYYADNDRVIGLFGQLVSEATVKNLQIGKEGATTKIECSPWHQNVFAGAIAGYNSGKILNCRAVNVSIEIQVSAQDENYKNWEFASNVGGICGVARAGTVTGCYVFGCNLLSKSQSTFNNISNTARCGGIIGYSDNSSLSDCFIENNKITSSSWTNDVKDDFWYTNKSGQPYPSVGGVIGHAENTAITRAVVVSNNNVTANKTVGKNSNGEGALYCGCMMGVTRSTDPGDLIGVNTTLNCSGSNSSYPNFSIITENSYELLIATDSSFDNEYWTSADGKIALNF